jgi:hypothetical protein
MVVVLRGKRVVAIGELYAYSHDEIKVSTSDMHQGLTAEVFPQGSVQLLKVAAAEFQ